MNAPLVSNLSAYNEKDFIITASNLSIPSYLRVRRFKKLPLEKIDLNLCRDLLRNFEINKEFFLDFMRTLIQPID